MLIKNAALYIIYGAPIPRLFSEYGYYDERLKIVADWAFFLKII